MIKAAKLLIVQEDETCKTEPGWTWDFKERISIPISTSSLGPPNPALLHTFGDITILHLLGAFMNKPQWREWAVYSLQKRHVNNGPDELRIVLVKEVEDTGTRGP